jgi:hypothetical protein
MTLGQGDGIHGRCFDFCFRKQFFNYMVNGCHHLIAIQVIGHVLSFQALKTGTGPLTLAVLSPFSGPLDAQRNIGSFLGNKGGCPQYQG